MPSFLTQLVIQGAIYYKSSKIIVLLQVKAEALMSRDNEATQGQAGKCPKRSNSIRKKECLRAASKAGRFSTSDAANTKDIGIDRKRCFLTRSLNIYFAPMGFRVQTELDNSKHYFFQMVTDIHERKRKYSQSSLFRFHIYRFHICEFAYWLKLICYHKMCCWLLSAKVKDQLYIK